MNDKEVSSESESVAVSFTMAICSLTIPWMHCTLQPLLRHAEEAGKAAGGSTLFIFTSDHGDGYTDKG